MRQMFKHVVMQPTTVCNLDCDYCYLPDRYDQYRMPVDVARAVADSLCDVTHPVTIVWHGGEPLACGLPYFESLLEPFEDLRISGKIRHNVQTNGTLITQDWCKLFKRYGFSVGLSIDGCERNNSSRVNWAKTPAYDRIMKGIGMLKMNRIEFSVIAVVSPPNIKEANEVYLFFSQLGCKSLSLNIAEAEGINKDKNHFKAHDVSSFWQTLFERWRTNPAIKIRELDKVMGWMRTVSDHSAQPEYYKRDWWPTVAWNGDVFVLSPEFLSVPVDERYNFAAGNILEKNMNDILQEARSMKYVRDYAEGVDICSRECEYFTLCGGGEASNKYFESKDLRVTGTEHCRNSRKLLADAVLLSLTSCHKKSSNEKGTLRERPADASSELEKLISSLPKTVCVEKYPVFNPLKPFDLEIEEEASKEGNYSWSEWQDKSWQTFD